MENLNQYQQQAQDFANKFNLKFKAEWLKYDYHFENDKQKRHVFKITLSRNGKRFSFTFGQSISADAKHPNLYDVLSCLQKYEVGEFEDFCNGFGYELYNENYTGKNKSSMKIYKAVQKEFSNVEKLFGDCLDELIEIQ
jgi:hypothetical protein